VSDDVRLPEINANERNDLRTRIAAALESADRVGYGTRPYAELADAVIAELDSRGLLIDSEAGKRLNRLKEGQR